MSTESTVFRLELSQVATASIAPSAIDAAEQLAHPAPEQQVSLDLDPAVEQRFDRLDHTADHADEVRQRAAEHHRGDGLRTFWSCQPAFNG